MIPFATKGCQVPVRGPMQTECSAGQLEFEALDGGRVVAEFDGGALCVENHESWLEAHRYLNMDYLREPKKETHSSCSGIGPSSTCWLTHTRQWPTAKATCRFAVWRRATLTCGSRRPSARLRISPDGDRHRVAERGGVPFCRSRPVGGLRCRLRRVVAGFRRLRRAGCARCVRQIAPRTGPYSRLVGSRKRMAITAKIAQPRR